MISIMEFENEVKLQISSLKKGKTYVEIKEELSSNYDDATSLKIAQEAFKRYKFKKLNRI